MLLAVLEKRVGFKLIQKDVFVNIAGGLRDADGKRISFLESPGEGMRLVKKGVKGRLSKGGMDTKLLAVAEASAAGAYVVIANGRKKDILLDVMSGADELGMLMMSRAINDDTQHIPFVAVTYNVGTGAETIPVYSNEKISEAIDGAIISIGGLRVSDPKNADLVVAVNTNPDGKTFFATDKRNNRHAHTGIGPFMKIVKSYVKAGYPVGIADISACNGADNALMNRLKNDNLQFKIRAYGGWNTATNSAGFLIGAGTLTKWMDEGEIYEQLLTRYLDEWAYQANVRQPINDKLIWTIPGEGGLWGLNEKQAGLEALTTQMIADFAAKNIRLPRNFALGNFAVKYPWSRTFEADVYFDLVKQ